MGLKDLLPKGPQEPEPLTDKELDEAATVRAPVDSSKGDEALRSLRPTERDPAEGVVPGEYRQPTEAEMKKVIARLRHRGYTNPLFDEVGQAFEKANPGWKTVWEYSPPDSKNQQEVMVRASLGYRIVYQREIPTGHTLPHTQEGGPVRVADAILMAAPAVLHAAIEADAARVAHEDANLPLESYKQALREKSSAGSVKGQALGDIKFSSSSVDVDLERLTSAQESEK